MSVTTMNTITVIAVFVGLRYLSVQKEEARYETAKTILILR